MSAIVLIGGGGHCCSCIDVIETQKKYTIAGIVDLPQKVNDKILDYKIFATDADLKKVISKYKNVLITIGQIKAADKRVKLFNLCAQLKAKFPVIKSSQSYVSKHAEILDGSIVMHQVVVNANARVGQNCIINTSSVIEHDVVIGNHTHISTGCIVNGQAKIGDRCFIGSKSIIGQGVTIASGVVIGAGAVVLKSINESGTYFGIPARRHARA